MTNVNNLENKIPDATVLIHINQYNTDKQNLEKKWRHCLKMYQIQVENFWEVENKIPDHGKYITTTEFYKLTAENFSAILKQADLVNKTDFDNKLISFNRKITSNKTKYLEVQKKQNSLTTKNYIFFLGRIYSTSNDGLQMCLFINQPFIC